ncbi:DUF4398 domain-containing protein [Marinospirillum sp.]|uniref:DUF4398 domain-containing protein n=1 Tax=Marinospirillum sp. TaxID=2183934 RepID=UPI00384D4C10
MKFISEVRPTRALALSLMLLLSLGLLSGCMSSPKAPSESMSEAREAITRTEQADGRQYASGELDEARRKLKLAEEAITREEMIEAKQLANEAKVMANLAEAKTESAKAKEINKEMEQGAKALTEEMNREGDRK